MQTCKCKACESMIVYRPEDVFNHWDYDYIFCPKCGEVIILLKDGE